MSFYNKEVASRFLNDPKTMTLDSGRGRLYTIGTTSPSQPRNTKAALGRSSSGGTPAGAIVDGGLELFININGFTDPLAEDDDAPVRQWRHPQLLASPWPPLQRGQRPQLLRQASPGDS